MLNSLCLLQLLLFCLDFVLLKFLQIVLYDLIPLRFVDAEFGRRVLMVHLRRLKELLVMRGFHDVGRARVLQGLLHRILSNSITGSGSRSGS